MDYQRLRNLTTHRLHTKMSDIYEDLEYITGMPGIMTHMLPRVMMAVEPWLREKIKEEKFWNGEYDAGHTGEYELPPMNKKESAETLKRFASMPSPFI